MCALRSADAGAPVDLELGAVIVHAQRDSPRPGTIAWTVHASATRHSHEAKAALSVIQYTLVMLEGLRKAVRSDTVTAARRRDLIEQERSILGFAVAAFLLVDPLSHPEPATPYHPKILRQLRRMPDLDGRLHLPAPPESDRG